MDCGSKTFHNSTIYILMRTKLYFHLKKIYFQWWIFAWHITPNFSGCINKVNASVPDPNQKMQILTKQILQMWPNLIKTEDFRDKLDLVMEFKSFMHSDVLKLCAVEHWFQQEVHGDNSARANNVFDWFPRSAGEVLWRWAAVRRVCNWSPLHH